MNIKLFTNCDCLFEECANDIGIKGYTLKVECNECKIRREQSVLDGEILKQQRLTRLNNIALAMNITVDELLELLKLV